MKSRGPISCLVGIYHTTEKQATVDKHKGEGGAGGAGGAGGGGGGGRLEDLGLAFRRVGRER